MHKGDSLELGMQLYSVLCIQQRLVGAYGSAVTPPGCDASW